MIFIINELIDWYPAIF